MEQIRRLNELADAAIKDLHQKNSDAALQAAIELMLTDRPAPDVVKALRAWADYLEDRI